MKYVEKFKENEIIFVGKVLMQRIFDIFITWGAPMPPHYINNNYYGKANSFLNLDHHVDISNKSYLKNIRKYISPTYFEGEEVKIKKGKKYFIKDIKVDNGEGIRMCHANDIGSIMVNNIVKKNYIVQEEIRPKLINGCKFDLRVFVCVCRNGIVFIYDNVLYRISSEKYNYDNTELLGNITNSCLNLPIEDKGGFFYDKHKFKDTFINKYHYCYLQQLNKIIPKIYENLLKTSNPLDNITKINEKNHFYIHGLDFMPDENNQLYFLESNSPPGHIGTCGIHNYHDFFEKATKFIVDKNITCVADSKDHALRFEDTI